MATQANDNGVPPLPNDALEQIRDRVEAYSDYYYYGEQQSGIDNRTKTYLFRCLLDHLQGGTVLEFGFVDGLFTDMLLQRGYQVTLVEGATTHVRRAQEKYGHDERVAIVHSLFETYRTAKRFDTVIAGDMLQFMDNPVDFLASCTALLAPGGQLIVTTPNCRSLHRRIGAVLSGGNPCEISAHERQTGTVRLYDNYSLRDILTQSGLHVDLLRGCFLKPLSSRQMDSWDARLLDAFNAVGEECDDMAWFLYAVCTPR